MKLPVVLIGEENIALASLRQHLAKDPDFPVDHKIQSFAEAEEVLRKKTGPVLVVVDLGREGEEAFRAAEDLKSKIPGGLSAHRGSATAIRAALLVERQHLDQHDDINGVDEEQRPDTQLQRKQEEKNGRQRRHQEPLDHRLTKLDLLDPG